MSKSLLEKFNKGLYNNIRYTQEEIKTLEEIGFNDIDEIDRIGFVETLQEIGKTFLSYFIGKPAKSIEPAVETGVTVLSNFEEKLDKEIELAGEKGNAVEYARHAILRSRLRKRMKDAAQFGANQIEYVASSTETAVEPFLEQIEQPLVDVGTAIGDYTATKTSLAAKKMVEGIGESAIGALEVVKNTPSTISNYVKDTYNSIPSISSFSSTFWGLVDSMSDFFYIICVLVLLGKFDSLLKNIYVVFFIALLIMYTTQYK